ncbi:MAG TPA: tryptophan synthase subunit alpha [Candidatus Thermoplasmatota archaeon]|nr:tryptophan synthase subunit alpha [Candidatus Thermoplasmatota archaeon]
MSRLASAFASARRPALVGYVMAGDPDTTRHLEYARAVLREADVLEIGVPFSDPVADGPTIERAAVRAIQRGAKLADALALARALRAESDKPLVLMTYYNPVHRYGLERFARDAAAAGVDGVILPDVPLEESERPGAELAKVGIDLVQLASPATPPERLARLAKATRGFLYLVSMYGVTGARKDLPPETLDLVRRTKAACAGVTPFAVGFGVSEPSHVATLRDAGADGVVVGSAIVGRIEKGEPPDAVAAYVRSLRG